MTETIHTRKKNVCVVKCFSFTHAHTGEEGFMTYTAASHQGVIKIFCLHGWGALFMLMDATSLYGSLLEELTSVSGLLSGFAVCESLVSMVILTILHDSFSILVVI